VQTGSQLTLSCAVKRSSGDPDYVYWYRNEDVLNYSPHVKIEDAASPEEQPLVSKLSVENVQKSHSGNYTCAPSNAWPASVLVHVVDDESGPAAMQHGNGAKESSQTPFSSHCSLKLTLLLLSYYTYITSSL